MRDTWAAYLVNIRHRQDRVDPRGQATRASSSGPERHSSGSTTSSLQPSSTVTMFDDHCCQLTGGGTLRRRHGALARARAEARPGRPARPRWLASYGAGRRLESDYMGDTQPLPERQRVRRLGLGAVPLRVQPLGQAAVRRRTPRARPQLPRHGRGSGSGLPLDLARGRRAPHAGATTTVYASWNGATQVTAWRVLGAAAARPDEGAPRVPIRGPASRPRCRCPRATQTSRSRRSTPPAT